MFDPSADGHHNGGYDEDPYGFRQQSWARFGDNQPSLSSSSSLVPSQHEPDHAQRRTFTSSNDMDWVPTPSDTHTEFHQHQHQNQHDDGSDNAVLDTFSPIQSGGGVKGMVAQWENKSYVPPLPPRPIQNQNHHHHHQQPQQHHQSQQSMFHLGNSSPSVSSHFGSLNAAAHNQPVGSPVASPSDSQFGSFSAHSRVASPIATSPPPMSFGSFQEASRVSTPMGGPSSGPFGSLDDFMSSHRVHSPMAPTPMAPTSMLASPGQTTPAATVPGTPGFEIWRPPAALAPKQEPGHSESSTSPSGFFRPPVPTTPKPIASGGTQFILDFNPSARVKGKAPIKPTRPKLPPRSSSNLTPQLKREPDTPQPSEPSISSATLPTLQQSISPRPQTGTRPSREQVPAEAWEQFKPTIRTLYLEERKPLKEVMSIMADQHGFQATPKMYKTRFSQWGFVKNNTEDEVKKLLSMKFQRDAEGKVSEFVRNGKVVNLGTYLKRKGVTEYDLVDFELPADLPSHIRCRTPTPPLAQGYLRSPDLMRAQELVVGNMRKAFLHCRQYEMDTEVNVRWPSIMVWGAGSSDLLQEANFYFEARDPDQGGHFLMLAFKQLELDLQKLSPQGIMEMLLGMVNRDLGLITALCKYLAAYSTTNLDRTHPWRLIFTCLYEVQQKHGSATLSDLLWGSIPTIAEELEAIYGRRHPYVARSWIDLALFYNHSNSERFERLVSELRSSQRQLEVRLGVHTADVLILRFAIMQLSYLANPNSDATRLAAKDVWSVMKGMNTVFPVRDSRPNVYCYHTPVKVDPWTKRCRRRYDNGVQILEEHAGVKVLPYFEEDFHTLEHAPDAQDAWAAAMHQMQPRWGHI